MTSGQTPAVRLESVTKRFGAVTAVDDLDLEIHDGEFFSMLGPSGSGKTTVLRMIAGFEAPTSGTVHLDGHDVTRQAPFARNVNTVFQDYALFPHLDVLGNVEYGLAVKKVPRKERRERAEEALTSVRLDGYGARKPGQLSGGQRQRVALARALVNRPKVLLLDEPLGALDLKLRREMQLELKVLQREVGITFVFVTHDQEEALTMSDRIAVFNDGHIEQVASPSELYETPASSFVAGFVGTSNLITGDTARVIIGRQGMFSIRPEKIHLQGTEEAAGLRARATGVIEAVVYLGSVNHYVVRLDDGGSLTVLRQNLHGTSDQTVGKQGDKVALAWADEHLIELSSVTRLGTPPGGEMRKIRTLAGTAAVGLAVVFSLAACGTDSGDDSGNDNGGQSAGEQGGFTAPDIPMAEELGDNEGALGVLAWPGYAEDGSTDKAVDWVTPFEKETGCQVEVKYFGTSDEAVTLMKSGQYDVVSASGDATLRLIAAGDVAPVNTDLIPNYADEWDFLKDRAWNSVNGQMYGVPHGYGANLLMYNTDVVDPAPTSWGAVFDGAGDYSGKVTSYDSPIYIADAALYLMKTQPDLGIEDPYALDADQLAAAVDLLKAQREHVGEYWSDYLKEIQAFQTGDSVIGTTWQVIVNLAEADAPVKAILPEEGATGWSDTWMIGADTKHPNCSYAWLNHITSPEANAAVAEWFGEAPANSKACDLTSEGFCDSYHAGDESYAEQIHYWTTPIEQCLDGRTDVTCTTYQQWTQAWTEIKG